ncbi:MAG: MFS transporter [Myxococcales bacterium]|nr:MFS transporter [Myxococcales bacterium]
MNHAATATRLPFAVRQAYGVGAFGLAVANTAILFFLFKYLTDVALISPGLVGAMMLTGKLWDAFSDPLIGRLSDQTAAAGSSRRNWLLMGAPVFGAMFAMLWWGPALSGYANVGYHLALLLIYFTAYTAVLVPYGALTMSLTRDYDDRTRLNTARMAWSMLGGIAVGVLLPGIVAWSAQVTASGAHVPAWLAANQGWRAAALLVCTFVAVPLLITGALTRERVTLPPVAAQGSIGLLWNNRRFRRVAVLFATSWTTIAVVSALVPFYVQHRIQSEESIPLVFAAIQLSALVFVPLAGWLSEVLDKHIALAILLATWAVAMIPMLLMGPGDMTGVLVCCILTGPGVAAAHVIPWSMLPDALSLSNGNDSEGQAGFYYGAMTLCEKLTSALALLVLGVVLEYAGYIPGAATQSESAVTTVAWLIGPFPTVILGCVAVMAWRKPPATRQEFHTAEHAAGPQIIP